MTEYRYYNNIKWGARYNPETHAHHVSANDYYDLRKIIPPGTDTQSIQVLTCQGWDWAVEVPTHLGGIYRE